MSSPTLSLLTEATADPRQKQQPSAALRSLRKATAKSSFKITEKSNCQDAGLGERASLLLTAAAPIPRRVSKQRKSARRGSNCAVSTTVALLHRRSAAAAARGHTVLNISESSTVSDHMHVSLPSIKCCCVWLVMPIYGSLA